MVWSSGRCMWFRLGRVREDVSKVIRFMLLGKCL